MRQLNGLNARIRFVRRIQIEYSPQNKDLVADHSSIVKAAQDRDAATGLAVLRSHISMTVTEARAALKEALLRSFVDETPGNEARRRVKTTL